MLAKVHLPLEIDDHHESLEWRIVDMLSGALANINKELQFFAQTAKKYGLDLMRRPPPVSSGRRRPFAASPVTEEYIQLFRSFGDEDPNGKKKKILLEGMLVLWATEKCYLAAWGYSKSSSPRELQEQQEDDDDDDDGGALRGAFIPNWTAPKFYEFVDHIAALTDELAGKEGATANEAVYIETWSQVLDMERRFWPSVL